MHQTFSSFVMSCICCASLLSLMQVSTGKAQSIFATNGSSAVGLSGSVASSGSNKAYGSEVGFSFLQNKADFGFSVSGVSGRSGGGMYLTIWGIKSEVKGNAIFLGINGGAGIAGSSQPYWLTGLSVAARLKLRRKIHIVFPASFNHFEFIQSFKSSIDVATVGIFPIFTVGDRITISPGLFISSSQNRSVRGGSFVFTFMSGVKGKKKSGREWN